MKTFEAEILGHDTGGAYIEIPFSVEEVYGVKGQLKVKAKFDGCDYRGSLAKMGHPCHILIVRKDIREIIGKGPGDRVKVELEKDTDERVVEVPQELIIELEKSPETKKFFEGLSFTNRKEYVNWITSAKRQETKEKRLMTTIEKLKSGLKNPYDKG